MLDTTHFTDDPFALCPADTDGHGLVDAAFDTFWDDTATFFSDIDCAMDVLVVATR
jgi:hypothetical protein